MSLSTGSAGCACRFLRRKTNVLARWFFVQKPWRRYTDGDRRGFFLVEVLVLSFLVLGCAASATAYRALAQNRAATGAELAAAYLAQEQIARMEAQPGTFLRTHTDVPWLGEGESPVEKNGTRFEVSSVILPHPETTALAAVEVHVRWRTGGRSREETYRKLVPYRD